MAKKGETGAWGTHGQGVRFNDESGAMTGYIDGTGKLWLKGEGGSLESWESPGDWLKEMLKVAPAKDRELLIEQLSEALGTPTDIKIADTVATVTKPLTPKPEAGASAAPQPKATTTGLGYAKTNGDTMATKPTSISKTTAKAPAKPVAKAKTAPTAKPPSKMKPIKPLKVAKPKAKPAADLPECMCGCGQQVLSAKRNFLQGHDARFHGYIKRYERGQIKLGELPALVQSHIRREKIVAGKG